MVVAAGGRFGRRVVNPDSWGAPLSLWRMHWDHELRNWSAGLRPGAIVTRQGLFAPDRSAALRFMESPLAISAVHRDHEPETRKPFGIKASVFRFMESPLGLATVHWDHEPNRPPARPRPRNQAIGSRTRTTTRTRTKGRFMESVFRFFACIGTARVLSAPIGVGRSTERTSFV